ncbi:chemokine (C-X-C motif) ligand 20 [Electrophorus electricus]|uniref:Chemokine interleukin-8-like domain-containing protein n=1 Tax=Electrophorus electricus TaxID=8005 RepID=A0A4W4DS18_ELEEL|nr:chemokine (C-X-C motif) ligand 20 [Electrophorus electricus]
MNATTVTLLFLIIFGVTATLCAGSVGGPAERCLCAGTLVPTVKQRNIGKMETFLPSPSCSKTELVITLKRGKRVCLDPDGKQGQTILQRRIEKKPKPGPKKRRGKKQKKHP